MTATHANWLLNSYVYGYALQAASLPFDTADELAEMTEDVYLPQLPADEFPYLNESASALMAAGYDPGEEFAFGLDLILAALEPLRDLHVDPPRQLDSGWGDSPGESSGFRRRAPVFSVVQGEYSDTVGSSLRMLRCIPGHRFSLAGMEKTLASRQRQDWSPM